MEDKIEEILQLVRENNILLKTICNYIEYKEHNAGNENFNDFIRNIMANQISNTMFPIK